MNKAGLYLGPLERIHQGVKERVADIRSGAVRDFDGKLERLQVALERTNWKCGKQRVRPVLEQFQVSGLRPGMVGDTGIGPVERDVLERDFTPPTRFAQTKH